MQDAVTAGSLCWDGVHEINERARQGRGYLEQKQSQSPISAKLQASSVLASSADDLEASQGSEVSVEAWFHEASEQMAAARADVLSFKHPVNLDNAGEILQHALRQCWNSLILNLCHQWEHCCEESNVLMLSVCE